jgi:ADP-ribose pyrophosphatase YjhB (NUDIX family)
MLVANAAVFRGKRILLIRRSDTGRWALPGGLTEVGETWGESAQRELLEEAGVRGTATKLLAVFDRTGKGGQHLYIVVFLVEVPAYEEPMYDGAETTDVGFFPVDKLPNVGATSMIPTVVKLARGKIAVPYFHPGPR